MPANAPSPSKGRGPFCHRPHRRFTIFRPFCFEIFSISQINHIEATSSLRFSGLLRDSPKVDYKNQCCLAFNSLLANRTNDERRTPKSSCPYGIGTLDRVAPQLVPKWLLTSLRAPCDPFNSATAQEIFILKSPHGQIVVQNPIRASTPRGTLFFLSLT